MLASVLPKFSFRIPRENKALPAMNLPTSINWSAGLSPSTPQAASSYFPCYSCGYANFGGFFTFVCQPSFSDETLIEAKQKLAQKTEELETLKRQYRHKVEQDVLRAHSQEAERLKHRERELEIIQDQTATQQIESQERMKMASHAVRHQQKVTQSKLGQRDRLRDEKKLIAEFLEQSDWTFTDGTKITYRALKAVAKRHQQQ